MVKDKIRSFGNVSADQPPPTAETRNRGSRPKAERRESQVEKKKRGRMEASFEEKKAK